MFDVNVEHFRFYIVKLAYIIVYNYLGYAITPAKNTDLSLPRAIASYLQFKVVDSLDLNYTIVNDQFGVLYTQHIFLYDVDNKSTYLNTFDNENIIMDYDFTKDILIMRLAAVMRMFEQVLSESIFYRSITNFFMKFHT